MNKQVEVINQVSVSEDNKDQPPSIMAGNLEGSSPPTSLNNFRNLYYPTISDSDWNDWHWQIRNTIRTKKELERFLELTEEELKAFEVTSHLPLAITPYYMGVVQQSKEVRKTVVPSVFESKVSCGEAEDPLGEDGHSPVPGLVHRYPDRVLLLAIDLCSNYCRYCTRSRLIGHKKVGFNKERLQVALSYIRSHKEIRDVLVSGGDPLYLSDENLDWLLSEIRSIEHVEIVRIGSKMPAVLPQRITSGLLDVLKKYHPLWMSLHFAHPDECTPETIAACNRLADAGIPLGSQTVLLKGINDDSGTMKTLMQKMLRMRVKPYYIYQCDPIIGTSHFRTPVSKGLEIMNALRGHTTGYAVPTYVIDAPGGGGKIPISSDNILRREDNNLILRNFEGLEFTYPDN